MCLVQDGSPAHGKLLLEFGVAEYRLHGPAKQVVLLDHQVVAPGRMDAPGDDFLQPNHAISFRIASCWAVYAMLHH